MARIAGINIPNHQHAEIALTSIFGIGHARAQAICKAAGVIGTRKMKDLADADDLASSVKAGLEKLADAVRRSDTIARLGGDEFGVLFERLPDRTTAVALMDGLQTALRDPVVVGPHSCQLSLSAGLALYPDDGTNADALISFADEQMYLQKLGLRPSDDRMLRIV